MADPEPDPDARSRFVLPDVPPAQRGRPVAVWEHGLDIATYEPAEPDKYPAFLDARVYQGSSGRVFPLPFHERIEPTAHVRRWRAVQLENPWLRVVMLPELGGRILVAYDKVAEYDFFYRNNVVKPALVGLAGPWISGGVEFNWPQHHRPATYLPTDVEIEHEPDGAVTVWCSDHDPFTRMKGMHGLRVRPDSSRLELRVRLHNRSEVPQSFLWWANVAARVGDRYQSFFPEDVEMVADHARRAVTAFPAADRSYYGVDYPARVNGEHPDADRLDWYRNIPVPTSYMALGTRQEFFGGYDHGRDAGFVHWAPREIAPGKKQWTWGDAPFGWAWDRNLTDDDGPYVELMAGVYTDNQPDFAWLAPGETKVFTQVWYPIRGIGPATHASRLVAVRVDEEEGVVRVLANETIDGAIIRIRSREGMREHRVTLGPDTGWSVAVDGPECVEIAHGGRLLLDTDPTDGGAPVAEPATAPPLPADVEAIEELVVIGRYLEQYRHATRRPEPYWEEALRRDPGETRAALALARRAYGQARYAEADRLLRLAVGRQTRWAPTPPDAEALYLRGLVLSRTGHPQQAADHLARAAWDDAWWAPAEFALARLLAVTDPHRAIARLGEVVEARPRFGRAGDLLAALARRHGDADRAASVVRSVLTADPLDQWARDLAGRTVTDDAPTLLDVALEYAAAGLDADALRVLDLAAQASARTPVGQVQVAPLVQYHRARLLERNGDGEGAADARAGARAADRRWCQASRLDDIAALEDARRVDPVDRLAALLLGNWCFDRDRRDEAMAHWRVAAAAEDGDIAVIAERNLGISAYNVLGDPAAAAEHYARALTIAPDDAKLLYEVDQLRVRRAADAAERLAALNERRDLVSTRDDLTIVLARLLVSTGSPGEARALILDRTFQPWEGGEGQVIGAWDAANLALARAALDDGRPENAVDLVGSSLAPPLSLGEDRHPLANTAELMLVLGDALAARGDTIKAEKSWLRAAAFSGDFARMRPQPYSLQTLWSVRALRRLGRDVDAERVLDEFSAWLDEYERRAAEIDFFATSLPNMLLFVDDPQVAHDAECAAMRGALAELEAARAEV